MNVEQDLELAVVRSVLLDPGGPSDEARARARAALLAALTADVAHADRQRPGTRRSSGHSHMRLGRVLPLASLAGVATAVGIALLVSQVFFRGGVVQPQPAAAALLRRAADAALASPPAHLGAGRYWYEENQGTYLDAVSASKGLLSADMSQVERYWIGARRWQRSDRLVKVRVVGAITRQWQRAALAQFGANPSLTGVGSSFDVPVSYDRMLKAPTDLVGLARFVQSAEMAPGFKPTGPIRAEALFTGIHDILIEPMVPARLQAGLFRLAATIPGVRALGMTHDTLGREGVAVGYVDRSHHVLAEFLFDPVSYALLDYRETALTRFARYIPVGTVTQETAFIRSGLVHQAPTSCSRCVRVGPAP